jgi:hypothetical protein
MTLETPQCGQEHLFSIGIKRARIAAAEKDEIFMA